MKRNILLFALVVYFAYGLSAAFAAPATAPPLAAPAPDAANNQDESQPVPTQRDWLQNMVDGLGWGFGLPDEPQDEDYLAILKGARTLRIEAEKAVPDGEPVSIKNLHSFGPFSGEGWVSGISTPVKSRLSFLLPVSGRYQLRAALRVPGHRLTIGETEFDADGGDHFTEVELGEVNLTAGPQEMTLALPPDGGIDYIDLRASGLLAIEPLGGWDLDKPLTASVLATTTIQLLNLLEDLPPQGEEVRIEAEKASLPPTADKTRTRYLGAPSGQAWVRAGAAGSSIELTFTPPAAGVYRLSLRALAEQSIKTVLDENYIQVWEFPPYLATRTGQTLYLSNQPHRFRVSLPARAGLDTLILTPLASSNEDFLNLSGLRSLGETIHFSDLDRLIPLLALLAEKR